MSDISSRDNTQAVKNIRNLLKRKWFIVILVLALTGLSAALTGVLFKAGVQTLDHWRLTLLEIFLFYNSYPITHILIVNLLVFLIGMTTKVRATAIGMFLGATNETIKKLINLPNTLHNLYGDGNLKRRLEEEAKHIKKNEIN